MPHSFLKQNPQAPDGLPAYDFDSMTIFICLGTFLLRAHAPQAPGERLDLEAGWPRDHRLQADGEGSLPYEHAASSNRILCHDKNLSFIYGKVDADDLGAGRPREPDHCLKLPAPSTLLGNEERQGNE